MGSGRPARPSAAARFGPLRSARATSLCHYGSGEPTLRPARQSSAARRPPLDKRLGQHHLVHGGVCRPMIEFLSPGPGDRVLEIGAGGGALTKELIETGARVLAVEVDPHWAFTLAGRAPRLAGLAIADALDLRWDRLPAPSLVAGNLPYGIGTALLERLLVGTSRSVRRAAFLLQSEVVDRIVAGPGDSAYGSLSVLVAARTRALRLGRVAASAFRPRPKVESAFVGLQFAEPASGTEDLPEFLATVRAAFALRRKTVRNSLASVWGRDRAEAALDRARIAPSERAERLGLREFVALHRAIREARGC